MLEQIVLKCICGGFVVGYISKFTHLTYCMDKKDRDNKVEWLFNVVYSFICAVLWLVTLCAVG
nr:MAG TPA: hypothetical protein [Caudoviricetes sp.]